MENDDPTAEALCELFAGVGISARDIVPWNAYPWYINRAPKAAELDVGVQPLKDVVDLLPNLRVVMLHGGEAFNGWKKLVRRYPMLVADKNLHVISTYHTSRQAFWHPDPKVREDRRRHLHDSFRESACQLGLENP
jgi:hypothetical protein